MRVTLVKIVLFMLSAFFQTFYTFKIYRGKDGDRATDLELENEICPGETSCECDNGHTLFKKSPNKCITEIDECNLLVSKNGKLYKIYTFNEDEFPYNATIVFNESEEKCLDSSDRPVFVNDPSIQKQWNPIWATDIYNRTNYKRRGNNVEISFGEFWKGLFFKMYLCEDQCVGIKFSDEEIYPLDINSKFYEATSTTEVASSTTLIETSSSIITEASTSTVMKDVTSTPVLSSTINPSTRLISSLRSSYSAKTSLEISQTDTSRSTKSIISKPSVSLKSLKPSKTQVSSVIRKSSALNNTIPVPTRETTTIIIVNNPDSDPLKQDDMDLYIIIIIIIIILIIILIIICICCYRRKKSKEVILVRRIKEQESPVNVTIRKMNSQMRRKSMQSNPSVLNANTISTGASTGNGNDDKSQVQKLENYYLAPGINNDAFDNSSEESGSSNQPTNKTPANNYPIYEEPIDFHFNNGTNSMHVPPEHYSVPNNYATVNRSKVDLENNEREDVV